jgi:hypothetical protein
MAIMQTTSYASEIRLECLKLAHRPGLSPQEVISIAREYLVWVGAVPPTTQETGPDDSQKVGKNKLAPTNPRISLPKVAAKAVNN